MLRRKRRRTERQQADKLVRRLALHPFVLFDIGPHLREAGLRPGRPIRWR